MKKIIYCLAILGAVFTGCNPNEDIYNDIDANAKPISGDVELTLSEEDYTDDVEDGGLGLRFPNFGSEDQAKELIPGLLDDKFPALKDDSGALVTYDLFFRKSDEKSLIVYKVTDQDYDDLGHRFSNFDSPSEPFDFLEFKYPDPEDRVLVSLTYDYHAVGRTNTFNNGYLYVDGEWQMIFGFSDDEYRSLGFRFANFASEDEAISKIPALLKEKFKFVDYSANSIVGTMYKLFVVDEDDVDEDGSTTDRTTYSYVKYFIFDGTNWSEYNNVISQQLQFGHDGVKWVPDNTIKYTLTQADYDLVGNGFFANFDVRSGKDEETEAVRLDKINTILLNNFPNDEEDQKYIVSYNVWNNGDFIWTMKVIKKGGVYVLNTDG